MNGSNPFGGKNPHGMYVPITEDEQEVLQRLVESQDLMLMIEGWGKVENFRWGHWEAATWKGEPLVVFGDKRITFYFQMTFTAPEVPQPCWYFDVSVRARGRVLFRQRMPTEVNGQPLQVAAGMVVGLALDVALDQIDSAFVKEIKPGAVGLTSRHGNMQLPEALRVVLDGLRKNEEAMRKQDEVAAAAATERMKRW